MDIDLFSYRVHHVVCTQLSCYSWLLYYHYFLYYQHVELSTFSFCIYYLPNIILLSNKHCNCSDQVNWRRIIEPVICTTDNRPNDNSNNNNNNYNNYDNN